MDFAPLKEALEVALKERTSEFRRIFHGRGGLWEELRFVTIDSFSGVVFVQFFKLPSDEQQEELFAILTQYVQTNNYKALVLKRRYIKGSKTELLFGEVEENLTITENGIRFAVELFSNQNIGYFGDMRNGRSYIESIAQGKKVLNLFSYTCGFSLFASRGGASGIVNVDMSKSSLAVGMKNHQINNLETKGVSFLPYNILKSFARLKRKAPFDVIIIDPPTFQRGSFEATKDYQKIIAKLPQLASENAVLLACLNAPELDEEFLKQQVASLAPSFVFQERLANLQEYKSLDEQRSLKNLVFQRKS